MSDPTHIRSLMAGPAKALLARVALLDQILREKGGSVSRAVIAASLNLHLLRGLLHRVPSGRAYVDDLEHKGRKLIFDHDRHALALLEMLRLKGTLPLEAAQTLMPSLISCFTRRHAIPRFSDYELLRKESAEMAWIATEGNAFNHATDRVTSLADVADDQRARGRRVKEQAEVSTSGRVRQTAFHADPVEREFKRDDGSILRREVPGSFFEFIERAPLPGQDRLDLAFDTNNAQGIFKMTAA